MDYIQEHVTEIQQYSFPVVCITIAFVKLDQSSYNIKIVCLFERHENSIIST